MKIFEHIVKLNQSGLKAYMEAYLAYHKYEPICQDGFLYAKGDVPVLLVAHLDTVHKECCDTIINVGGKISSPQGIGADDRAGVRIIAELVKELHCSVLLCEDEEKGGIGASKFCSTKYISELDVNYMIEFDRRGNNDAVFYQCDNPDFTEFVCDTTGYKFENGSFSDISRLAPKAGIAAVNLSCGYYKAHTKDEYLIWDELLETIASAKTLIKTECTEPFKYIQKKYEWPKFTSPTSSDARQMSLFDYDDWGMLRSPHKGSGKLTEYEKDFTLELEVVTEDENGQEKVYFASGNTKAECWADLFLNNTTLCFDMIVDWSFS